MRLAQTRIVTTDVRRLAGFYEDVLGTAAEGSEEYVELRAGGAALAISSERAVAVYGARAGGHDEARPMILDFETEDVDAERRRLDGIVARFLLEPTTQPWGNRSMVFRDPDGNLVNIFSRVSTDERD